MLAIVKDRLRTKTESSLTLLVISKFTLPETYKLMYLLPYNIVNILGMIEILNMIEKCQHVMFTG